MGQFDRFFAARTGGLDDPEVFLGIPAEEPVFGEDGERDEVGGQDGIEGARGANRLENIEEVGAGEMIEQRVPEMEHDFIGNLVDEIEPVRLAPSGVYGPVPDDFHQVGIFQQELFGFMVEDFLHPASGGFIFASLGPPLLYEIVYLRDQPVVVLAVGLQGTVQEAQNQVFARLFFQAQLPLIVLIGNAVDVMRHHLGGRCLSHDIRLVRFDPHQEFFPVGRRSLPACAGAQYSGSCGRQNLR